MKNLIIIFLISSFIFLTFQANIRNKNIAKNKIKNSNSGLFDTLLNSESENENEFGENKSCPVVPTVKKNFDSSDNILYGRSSRSSNERISGGDVAVVYDVLMPFFNRMIRKEFEEMWKIFKNSSKRPMEQRLINNRNYTMANTTISPTIYDKIIVYEDFIEGASKAKWPVSARMPMFIMDILNQFGSGVYLNFKQFVRASIDILAVDKDFPRCKNCYQEVRYKVFDLFEYIDCHKLGEFTSKQFFEALKLINKSEESADSAATNDFILKNGSISNGSCNKRDFIRGIFIGYWERLCGDYEIDDNYKQLYNYRVENARKERLKNKLY